MDAIPVKISKIHLSRKDEETEDPFQLARAREPGANGYICDFRNIGIKITIATYTYRVVGLSWQDKTDYEKTINSYRLIKFINHRS